MTEGKKKKGKKNDGGGQFNPVWLGIVFAMGLFLDTAGSPRIGHAPAWARFVVIGTEMAVYMVGGLVAVKVAAVLLSVGHRLWARVTAGAMRRSGEGDN